MHGFRKHAVGRFGRKPHKGRTHMPQILTPSGPPTSLAFGGTAWNLTPAFLTSPCQEMPIFRGHLQKS